MFYEKITKDGQADPNLLPNNLIGTTPDRGYTGHEHLDELGLIHMNCRIYDPTVARFMAPDQKITYEMVMQNFNRYSYVYNHPMSFVDLDGLEMGAAAWVLERQSVSVSRASDAANNGYEGRSSSDRAKDRTFLVSGWHPAHYGPLSTG